MNIVVIGRSEILYETILLLAKYSHNIKLIVTAKEAPEYTKTGKDFESLSKKMGANFLYAPDINKKENIELLKINGVLDIGVSFNYVNVISQEVINLFSYGILNAHGGDLPRYRGNACQAWAIINGEKRIGLCIHKMEGGELDSGDIIARKFNVININTKIGDLWQWMTEQIPKLYLEAISKLEKDKDYILKKQSKKPLNALRCYPRIPEDGRIIWNKSNIDILRLINASSEPYRGAYCKYEGKELTIWNAGLYKDKEQYCAVPGQVSYVDKNKGFIVVITGSGKLKITEIEYGNYRGAPAVIIQSIRKRLK